MTQGIGRHSAPLADCFAPRYLLRRPALQRILFASGDIFARQPASGSMASTRAGLGALCGPDDSDEHRLDV
ncbi:hypothetical protein PCL1606_27770 [Pseudomonas chlororaphis]|uniref:Uncharacterized protein n=1 Tax=Pseudomonas chlororaphis TaxID=587753 RepID=A0A0D5XZU4_9PSED|nr:hypothetical protein PCL1606_27770 [Pseudomonas chlororaphis]